MGADAEQGAIAVGDYLKPGQTVQFHIRDAETADAELHQLLARAKDQGARPQGALLFSCNGRGTRLFPQPHHDVIAIEQTFGRIPTAGFFAAGEFGPIGGKELPARLHRQHRIVQVTRPDQHTNDAKSAGPSRSCTVG